MAAGAFACRFVRRDCEHEELFRSSYQRTNRTKGSKILRCYPHCCPDHVARSFCGAPLHVDVSATSLLLGRGDEPPVLLVFGRFRLRQSDAPAVGDLLAPAAVAASIQSDDNPNGEWIRSTLLQGPGPRGGATWRFEVNSSARWFYGWESGVAKSHRLREHVLDVVVATPESHDQSQSHSGAEWLRVVAVATSPPFKMISFRRATPAAMTLLTKSAAPTVPVEDRLPVSDRVQPQQPHRRSVADLRGRPSHTATARPRLSSLQPQPPPDSAIQLADLATVWSYIQSIALSAALPLASAMERAFWRHLDRATGASGHTEDDLPTMRRCGRPPVDQTLALLLQDAGDPTMARTQPPRAPSPLLKISIHVALWLCWNDALHDEWQQLVDDAVDMLLDTRELVTWFDRAVVGWAWQQLSAFLIRTDWTLAALVTAMREVHKGPQLSHKAAFEAFVAHARERFVDHQREARGLVDPGQSYGHTAKRRRRQEAPDAFSVRPVTTLSQRSLFDGDWTATLDDLHVRPASTAADISLPLTSWRLEHLMRFWRQLSAVSVRLDADATSLRVRSQFHLPSGSHSHGFEGTELVLDHRCRWFRRFPCGSSTLAFSVGGESFGDYVGKVSRSRREIHLNLYAWPSPGQCPAGPREDGGHNGSELWASCFQIHIVTLEDASHQTLHVNVAVNRGRVDWGRLGTTVDAAVCELLLRSLPERLALVPQWLPSGHWRCEYSRSGR